MSGGSRKSLKGGVLSLKYSGRDWIQLTYVRQHRETKHIISTQIVNKRQMKRPNMRDMIKQLLARRSP